jgi:hypothetical protein
MSQATVRRSISRIGLLQIAIIILTVLTAIVHLQKGLTMLGGGAPPAGLHAGPGGIGGRHGGGFGGGRPGGGGGPSLLALLPIPLPVLFLLNGIAYLVLIIALYLPALRPYQNIVRWLLIILAALTIVSYFLIAGTRFNLLGYIDKPIEVALIVLLLIEARQAARVRPL